MILDLFIPSRSPSSASLEDASTSAVVFSVPAPPSASAVQERAPRRRAQARPRVRAPARRGRRANRNQAQSQQCPRHLNIVDDDADDLDEWEELDPNIHHLRNYEYTGPDTALSFIHPRTYGEHMRGCTPLDFFSLFFTMELWQMLADETNRYVRHKIGLASPLRPRSVWHG